MKINDLVDSYFPLIQVTDTDFYSSDGVDLAYISLRVPKILLREFSRLKGKTQEFPEVREFWRETNLRERLMACDKYRGQGHEPMSRILNYLKGNISGEYTPLEEDVVGLDIFQDD